eukprot:m.41349 g.41349  ORF g.41349 m.41349 type:complete len:566 (-) comp5664_c0_seq1:202-1899(-)
MPKGPKAPFKANTGKVPPSDDPTKYCGFCCKMTTPGRLLTCACGNSGHPSCLSLNRKMVERIRKVGHWQCIECKECSVCKSPKRPEQLLFCDGCDGGTHMDCLTPPLSAAPSGSWFCPICKVEKVDVEFSAATPSRKRKKAAAAPASSGGESGSEGDDSDSDNGSEIEYLSEDDEIVLHAKAKPKAKRKSAGESTPKSAKRRGRPPGSASRKTPVQKKARVAESEEEEEVEATPRKKSRKPKGDGKRKNDGRGSDSEPEQEPPEEDKALFQRAQQQVQADISKIVYTEKKEIEIGRHVIKTWYLAPYPEEYMRLPTIYLCEFCMKYMKSPQMLERHMHKCDVRGHPPGTEIYRDGSIQVWEVDGKKAKVYCQNVCLLAKLFLDHKTLYYDVEPFLFYVMTEYDEHGSHFIGYFSKEKRSMLGYNVSCILTMPFLQRQGYGKLLIEFSYLLNKTEGKVGTPERPLSALGKLTYTSYWKDSIMEFLVGFRGEGLAIHDICAATGMTPEDVISTLQELGMLKQHEGTYVLAVDPEMLASYAEKLKRPRRRIDPSKLRWTPPTTRTNWF